MRVISMVLMFALASVSSGTAAPDDIHFATDLSPDEQSAPTESPGRGRLELWLERDTLKITWQATFKDLTSRPTQLGLFGPESPGANAGLLLELGGRNIESPASGTAVLSDGQFQYLITTRIYVNLLTEKYPSGELRGQLRRTRKLKTEGSP